MGNIVGERFENYVLAQIAARQKLYGSGIIANESRTPSQIQLINNKNAWLKMASSLSVIGDNSPSTLSEAGTYVDNHISSGEKRLRDIGIENTADFTGTGLAKKTVLFNTLSELDGDEYNFRSGVSNSTSLWNNNNTYGLGGTNQGIVPAPGLISFSLESKNRGSIREGTIELKCYNKFQFELIELVYLRLGFTLMIEWGWDKYTTNSQDIKDVGNTIIEDSWFKNNTNITQLEMIRTIEGYRKKYFGNYDGFYGRVVNFNWSFDPDGTYNISIDVISVGDVIESLSVASKATTLSLKQISNQVSASYFPEGLGDSPIVTNAGSTALSQDMFQDICGKAWDEKLSDYLNPTLFFTPAVSTEGEQSAGSTDKYGYYMTFGALIKKIQTYAVPKLLTDFGEASDVIEFDSNPDSNLCTTYPNQISLDPRICIIKPPISVSTEVSQDKTYINFSPGWDYLKEFAVAETEGNVSVIYGKIMNIYINYDFISRQLNKATDAGEKKTTLSIFQFLQNICDGINTALGDINNLEVILKDDKVITILEQNPIPGAENVSFLKDKLLSVPSFEMFGINPTGQASFVTDFKFDTKITPELANLISIGATAANKPTKDYDATAFSKWNEGLYDRYNKEYVDPALEVALQAAIALADQANELGITSFGDLSSEEVTKLYNSWVAGEEDRGDDEVVEDFFVGIGDVALTLGEGTGHVVDWAREGLSDGYNTFANWAWRDEDEQVDTSGDNVENITNPDLSERLDSSYSQNQIFKAAGVELQGYRIATINDVYPQEGRDLNGGLNWEEYVNKVDAYVRAEKLKAIAGKYTPEELAVKFGKNYIFYLTRVLGGDFAAGSDDGNTGFTPAKNASYFLFNDKVIKEGKAAFETYVNTSNQILFFKKGIPSGQIGFIPIDLGFSFVGMSGIKIYNQINVRQGFLPKQYPKTYKFLISTVDHEISDNKWETSLSTITIPRTFAVGKYNFDDLASAADTYVRGNSNPQGGRPENFTNTTNADTVRAYIKTDSQIEEKRSGDNGFGGRTKGVSPEGKEVGELSSGGDITAKMAEQTIAVMKAIRIAAPSIRIKLTGGNDLYHHNKPKSYTSLHESGGGLDFTISPATDSNQAAVRKVLNSFIVGPKNWWYIDEYRSLTSAASGNHYHMSQRQERKKLNEGGYKSVEEKEAKEQLAAGTITKKP